MSAHRPYDQERIVRTTEIHDQPTELLPRTTVLRRETSPVVDADVVHEEVDVAPTEARYGDAESAVSESVQIDHVVARRALLVRISSVIWFVIGMLEIAIGLRIVFRLLEANANSGFVTFINDITEPFVRPFQGVFTDPSSNGAVLDAAALLAMLIWLVVAWAGVRLIWLLLDKSESGMSRSVHDVRRDHA